MGSPPPRAHFDDFASAFITVFTISSGEDWNAVFASALETGAPYGLAASFFVPLFIIDNYVLVNLFVAIICWGWESADTDDEVVTFTVTVRGSASDFAGGTKKSYREAIAKIAAVEEAKVRVAVSETTAGKGAYDLELSVLAPNQMAMEHAQAALMHESNIRTCTGECGLKYEGCGAVSIRKETPESVQSDLEIAKERLRLAHEAMDDNAKSLQKEHFALKQQILKLGKDSRLGLSASESTRLVDALELVVSDFLSATTRELARSPLSTAESVAGLTLGLSSIACGMRQLLTQLGSPEATAGTDVAMWPSDKTLLLLEYMDCEHARARDRRDAPFWKSLRQAAEAAKEYAAAKAAASETPPASPMKKGAKGGNKGNRPMPFASQRTIRALPPPPKASEELPELQIGGRRLVEQLELLLREYAMSVYGAPFDGQVTMMADLEELRGSARSFRAYTKTAAYRRDRINENGTPPPTSGVLAACWGACCNGSEKPAGIVDDALGASFVPLGDMGLTSRTRLVRELVDSSVFTGFILLCIVVSAGALAFDAPDLDPTSETARVLGVLDVTFTSIFVAEMSLKIYSLGAFAYPDGYFRDSWNQLDATIVTTSVLSLILKDVDGLGALRAMRALRALRPLRVIKRFPGLRKVVSSLFRAIPQVSDVFQVCILTPSHAFSRLLTPSHAFSRLLTSSRCASSCSSSTASSACSSSRGTWRAATTRPSRPRPSAWAPSPSSGAGRSRSAGGAMTTSATLITSSIRCSPSLRCRRSRCGRTCCGAQWTPIRRGPTVG